jgi:hypothetical protein
MKKRQETFKSKFNKCQPSTACKGWFTQGYYQTNVRKNGALELQMTVVLNAPYELGDKMVK